ncbi:DUF3891 family protein [Paenibacillus nasutitermitis]|uniref:Serine hydroxymethyltransferase n=1 Tax=Paenibacillus nasutitermitis TaxID=1652958 RepID=A0A917DPC7_9BACL|nr:DUF3891 family protein [Paenibacillus nasutitermitis]GGD53661.1 serine hydroxymethyltransferase [Paenibacillus nasutitermitis]
MIVYEKATTFVLINQHDHAQISGDLASQWKDKELPGPDRKDDLVYAAYEHDRGWIDLDAAPLWNDAKQCPYSFRDFPLRPRFVFYKKGIDEVAARNPYAALLCSLLYTTLFERIRDEETNRYLQAEYARQQQLLGLLQIDSVEDPKVRHHLGIMLVCDELSLFLCMKAPGTPARDYEWFGSGIHYYPETDIGETINVHWISSTVIGLSLFPFRQDVSVVLPYKEVGKRDIQARGMIQAYREAVQRELRVTFTGQRQA